MSKSSAAAKERARARSRNREHLKRSTLSDITPAQELAMRRKARNCPLCDVRLTVKRGQPNSKHLDHIIPICVGGTHTHGNVRIICAACNLSRPKDGSDYSGPITLWAQGPSPVTRSRKKRIGNVITCRKGLHPWVPSNIVVYEGKKRCLACRQASDRHKRGTALATCKCGASFAAPGNTLMCAACTDQAARKAAELHASGMTWPEVAALVGYGSHNGEGARYAAKRIGYIPERLPTKVKAPSMCGCGEPKPFGKACDGCAWRNAMFAAAMQIGAGWTSRMIADHLSYSSISSVANLLASVGIVNDRMGRRPKAA